MYFSLLNTISKELAEHEFIKDVDSFTKREGI